MVTLTLDGLHNFRDLGGLPLTDGGGIRPGVLYRSDALSALTDAGLTALSASPIAVVVDFRTPFEQESAPDRLPADRALDVVELSVLEGALTGAAGAAAADRGPIDTGTASRILAALPRLGDLYVQMLEHGAASFAEAARQVAAGPTLVHCTAGKDRTGVAIALVLDAVGVEREAVIADYALSERNLAGPWADRMLAGVEQMGAPLTPEIRELVTGTPPASMAQALRWTDERGGSAAYLRSGGLTDAELDALRRRLVAG